MTCIVGYEHGGRVHMAGDSEGASNWDMRLIAKPKIFQRDKMLIGYTTSFRMGQILQYGDFPPNPSNMESYEYLIRIFIPFVRKTFLEAGFLTIKDSFEEGGEFMIGIRSELFTIQSNFSVLRHVDGFEAIGSGSKYALGALNVLKQQGLGDTLEIIKVAMETAAYFSNGVSAPFMYMTEDYGPIEI